jgi:hypothetical protein
MSITVVIARDDVGAPTTREVYANGVKFTTENGDLSIVSGKPQLLATYGSGNWLSVHVDDFVDVVVTRPPEDEDSSDFGDSFGDSFGDDSDDSSDESSDDSDSDGDTDSDDSSDDSDSGEDADDD